MARSALDIVRYYHPEVREVKDALKDKTFVVTKRDCRDGTSLSVENCALARSIRRQYDGVVLSLCVAYLVKGKAAHRYLVPVGLAREITTFDRDHDFVPGSYRLRAPYKGSRLGAPRDNSKRKPQPGAHNKTKKRAHRTTGVRMLKGAEGSFRKELIL
jgi:hypothetical protein